MRPARFDELLTLEREEIRRRELFPGRITFTPAGKIGGAFRSWRTLNIWTGCVWALATAAGFCIATTYYSQTLPLGHMLVVIGALICSTISALVLIAFSIRGSQVKNFTTSEPDRNLDGPKGCGSACETRSHLPSVEP
jgi:hypothetical protein